MYFRFIDRGKLYQLSSKSGKAGDARDHKLETQDCCLIDILTWAFKWNALLIKCSEETKINKERVDLKVGRRQAQANMALLIIHALLF